MFILRLYPSGILRDVLWQVVTGFLGQPVVLEAFFHLGRHADYVGSHLLTFRYSQSVPSSWTAWYLKVIWIGCAEVSASGCQTTRHSIRNERNPQVQCGVNRMSWIVLRIFCINFYLQYKSFCTQYHYMVYCKKTGCVIRTYNRLTS